MRILLIHDGGNVTPIVHANGVYTSLPVVANAVPTGSWKSSAVVDIDGDGTKEIIVNGYGSANPQTFLLQFDGSALTTTMIADLGPHVGAGGRLYGGDVGDIDGDGNLDYVFGTRGGTPNAAIYRVEYQDGDITDPANYYISRIDEMLFASGGRYDVISLGNVDADPELEVMYSGIPATAPVPLVILDLVPTTDLLTIAEAKKDLNGDFVPDMLNETVTVSGVVLNKSLSSSSMQIYIQDATGGLQMYAGGKPAPATLKVGDRVIVTGKIIQYSGLNEIEVVDPTTDVVFVDSSRAVLVKTLTIDDYLAKAEMYEGTMIKISGVAKTATSPAWPLPTKDANLMVWTGTGSELVARVDKDTDVDDGAEPVWPVDIVGVATQFDSNTPASGGYQITLLRYAEITQDVKVAPLPFALLTPANNSVVEIKDSSDTFELTWEAAVDLNNDVVGYQFVVLPALFTAESAEPKVTISALDILALMNGADSITVEWNVIVLDATTKQATSKDKLYYNNC